MSDTYKRRNSSIDGLRGIAILFVLVDHYIYFSGENILNPFFSYFINSNNGVDLFFIISSYLITNILVKEYEDKGQIDLLSFYWKRALRILPALYFLIFIYFILYNLHIIYLSKSTWLSSIFLIRQFIGSGWESSHLWSLSVENIFYIIFPIIVNRFKIIGNDKILYCVFIFLLMIPIIRFFIHTYTNLSTLNIFFRCEGLLFGALIALRTQFISKINKNYILFVFIISSTILYFVEFVFPLNNSNLLNYILRQYVSILNVLNISLLFCYIINLKNGIVHSIVNNSILLFIGIISYSVYLWQQIFFSKNDIFYIDNVSLRFLILFLIALFSYYFIENPFNKFKAKFK
jgi:peptidoglycan/LPS O-acetylase OafA/YrhL